MPFSIPTLSFTGGIWAPSLWSRADLEKYRSAVADLQNFIVHPHGGISNRPGTEYLGALVNNALKGKLVPFQFSQEQAYLLVCETEHIRFIMDGSWIVEQAGNGDNLTSSAAPPLKWTASANGASEYYCELVAGGDPSLSWGVVTSRGPATIRTDVAGAPALLVEGTAGHLVSGEWVYGDNDTLGYNTVYVRLLDDTDPDTKGAGWIEAVDYIYITNPWTLESEVDGLKWTQKADRIYLFSPGTKPVFSITRTDHWTWTGDQILNTEWGAAISEPRVPTRSNFWHNLNDSIRYQWTASNKTGAPGSEYFLELKGGGDPGFKSVAGVRRDALGAAPTALVLGTLGSLALDEYAFGQQDGLNFSTVYVRVVGDVDPDTFYNGSMAGNFTDRVYVVTAVSVTGEESLPSVELPAGLWDSITWNAPQYNAGDVDHYNVYRRTEDADVPFGFVGTNNHLYRKYVGSDITPDVAKGPPEKIHPFAESGIPANAVEPSVGAFYDQRLLLAAPNQYPQTIWGSVVGFYENLLSQVPVRDDAAFEFTIDATEVNAILWITPAKDLVLGTAGGVWIVKPGEGSPVITPASIDAKRHTRLGSANVVPEMVGNEILYVQRGGQAIRGLGYRYENDSYGGADLSIMANHLFDTAQATRISWQREPHNVLWVITDEGALYGMTYAAEHGIAAWHRHVTLLGIFEDVVSLPSVDGLNDDIYFIIRRAGVRMIERLGQRFVAGEKNPQSAYFVDCGLRWEFGSNVTEISGLKHLNNKTVDILADGNLIMNQSVTNGKITLAHGATKVAIGLALPARMDTLEILIPDKTGSSQDKAKAVSSLVAQVENSRQMIVSPVDDESGEFLTYVPFRSTEDYGDPTVLFTGKKQVMIDVNNLEDPRIKIEVRGVPLTLMSLVARGDAGDY